MQCAVVAKGTAGGLGDGVAYRGQTEQGERTEAQKYPRRKTNLIMQTYTEKGLQEHLMGAGAWGATGLGSEGSLSRSVEVF